MVGVNPKSYQKYKIITDEYKAKLQKIKDDTQYYSSPTHMLEHPDFTDLIAEGPKIIPWLIHHATNTGFNWTILNLVFHIEPESRMHIRYPGQFYSNISDILRWFVSSKHRDHDVYYNLIEAE